MKLWLDDVRPVPDESWTLCTNTADFIILLLGDVPVAEVSFDHDLGENEPTGYDAARLIERLAYEGKVRQFKWACHSDNPPGKAHIEAAMKSADRFWKSNAQI